METEIYNITQLNEVAAKQPIIKFLNVYKSYGDNKVLNGINFSVNKGENLVILGRSRSGKSVAVKYPVGLTKVDKDTITVMGKDITRLDENELNKIRLKIGFLFQNGALYDSMSVKQNLAFTLKNNNKNLNDQEVKAAILEA